MTTPELIAALVKVTGPYRPTPHRTITDAELAADDWAADVGADRAALGRGDYMSEAER